MQTIASKIVTTHERSPAATIEPKRDGTRKMKAVEFHGTKDFRVNEVGVPLVTDPHDAIIRVTSTCICGSDLHMYVGAMPGLKFGDIMGHEFMGIITDVGEEVQGFKVGDRVVAAFDIACGSCFFCKHQVFSSCDATNPSEEQEAMYGHHTSGIFGYSHLTGGYPGGRAEYARVPLAEQNLLKVDPSLCDEAAVLLSDILPTAWHGCELAGVGRGDRVAIWGAGPVGILAAHCAFARDASRVVLIDEEQYRLDFAKAKVPGVETVNFKEKRTLEALRELFPDGTAPDCCIEAVGFHYTKSWLHWFETALKLETDPSEMLNELIYACRKGGRIGVIGVYAGYTNHFNIGAFMEKGLTMAAGQCPVQKYWKRLQEMVKAGDLHPEIVVTHKMPLTEAPRAYRIFNDKEEGCIKVVLKPEAPASGTAREQ